MRKKYERGRAYKLGTNQWRQFFGETIVSVYLWLKNRRTQIYYLQEDLSSHLAILVFHGSVFSSFQVSTLCSNELAGVDVVILFVQNDAE